MYLRIHKWQSQFKVLWISLTILKKKKKSAFSVHSYRDLKLLFVIQTHWGWLSWVLRDNFLPSLVHTSAHTGSTKCPSIVNCYSKRRTPRMLWKALTFSLSQPRTLNILQESAFQEAHGFYHLSNKVFCSNCFLLPVLEVSVTAKAMKSRWIVNWPLPLHLHQFLQMGERI